MRYVYLHHRPHCMCCQVPVQQQASRVAAWDWSVMVVRVTALVTKIAILLVTAALIFQTLAQLLVEIYIHCYYYT